MKHNRQSDAILDEMLNGRRITQLEMLQEHGVGRLASRISDLRNEGYLITSRRIPVEKGDGSRANVSQYWMVPGVYCSKKEITITGRLGAEWTAIQERNLDVRIYNDGQQVCRIENDRIRSEQELRHIAQQVIRDWEG